MTAPAERLAKALERVVAQLPAQNSRRWFRQVGTGRWAVEFTRDEAADMRAALAEFNREKANG